MRGETLKGYLGCCCGGIDQAGAADHVGPKPRDIQFRGENGRRHISIIKTTALRRQLQRFMGLAVLFHRDDDIALFVSCFDIPVSLDNLFQRIASINDWFYLSRFNQLFEEE